MPTSALYVLLDPEESRFLPWLALYAIQFALYAALAFALHRRGPIPTLAVVAAGLLSRLVLLDTVPVLESDYYRYLWDGHVLSHGVNPYLHPPEHPALDPIETDYRFFIQHSHLSTIYPPVAQLAFWLAHALSPDSLVALKLVFTAFDVATGLLLVRFFEKSGLHGSWSALYFLNPLVLKEVASSAHLDALPMFLSLGAVYLMVTTTSGRLSSWVLLALASGAKLYALALVPLFARLDPKLRLHAPLAGLAFALLYVPFLGAGSGIVSGTRAFGEGWLFNASLFRVIDLTGGSRLWAAVAFGFVVVYRARQLRHPSALPSACLFGLGSLLLLSPVVNAWYVLWLLPFACLERRIPWLSFTFLVALSYSWFHSRETAYLFQAVEYGVLFALLLWDWRRRLAPRRSPVVSSRT